MHLVDTPLKFFIFVGLVFSLLIAFAAWGNTFLMLYDEKDKSYVRREAIKSGIRVFLILMFLLVAMLIVLPHIQ